MQSITRYWLDHPDELDAAIVTMDKASNEMRDKIAEQEVALIAVRNELVNANLRIDAAISRIDAVLGTDGAA